jgi:protein phosphatase
MDTTGHNGPSGRFKYGAYGYVSDRGLNPRRTTNEDSYLVLDEVPLFAVADGVGGQNAGEVASQTVVEILKNQFSKKARGERGPFLEQVIQFANRYLYDMALDDDALSGMATTLALILLEPPKITIGHVGDSRVYRFTDGRLHRETVDHSLAEDLRYSPLGIKSLNRNVITRALGVEPEVEPEFKTITLASEDTFLLCTDGVTRHVSDEELAETLATLPDPQDVCDRLKDLCYERGARDNLTAVVVKLENEAWAAGLLKEEAGYDGAAPTQQFTRPGQAARIQVTLNHQDETAPEQDAPPAPEPPLTFSGQMAQAHGPLAPRRASWLLWTGLIAVAILSGFAGGLYVQRNFTMDWMPWSEDSADAPARQFFEEGLRAFEAGRHAEAQRAFREAVGLSPTTPLYHHWLGRTQLRLKQYPEAAHSFETAAASHGGAENYLYAAAACDAAGQQKRAEELLAAYVKAIQGQ